MRIGWFGNGLPFPSERLLYLLQDYGEVWAVQARHKDTHLEQIPTISLHDWDKSVNNKPSVAIVTHPLWVRVVVQHRPTYVIVIVTKEWAKDEQTGLCSRILLAEADMVVATSERVYLEQCFRREGVFLWHGDDQMSYSVLATGDGVLFLKDYEAIVQFALKDVFHGIDLIRWSQRQWMQRLMYYEKLLKMFTGPQETTNFLIASYKYLLKHQDAPDNLLQSFKQMTAKGYPDCLQGQYRFLSAMQAQAGRLEDAIQTYGISATNEMERKSYHQLLDMYNLGANQAALAKIYWLNDDIRTARNMLANPQTELEKSLYARILVELQQVDKVLDLVSGNEKRIVGMATWELNWLRGRKYWQSGQSFAAMHQFLLAASENPASLQSIYEWTRMEDAISEFTT